MPQGACTPLNDEVMDMVWARFMRARQYGLEHEWLQWFLGGITINNMPIVEAAEDACYEWDI